MNDILNESTIVKEQDFNKPDFHEIEFLLDDIVKDCRNKYFNSFEYRLVYDIKFTNTSNYEEVNFTNIHRSMDFKTESYGVNQKIKNARQNRFIFIQIKKRTIQNNSILSKINVQVYLKLRIPKMHRQFLKKILPKPWICENFLH